MKKRLRALKREIERRGGLVHLEPDMPEALAELFLREIVECPDCLEAARDARRSQSSRDH